VDMAIIRNSELYNLTEDKTKLLFMLPDSEKTEELCLEAIKDKAEAIRYLPPKLQTKEFYFKAVTINPYAIDYVPPNCLTDEMRRIAVKPKDELVVSKFKISEMYDHKAVKQNIYVPKASKPEPCHKEVQQLKNMPEDLDICFKAVMDDLDKITFVPHSIKKLIEEAVAKNIPPKELCLKKIRDDAEYIKKIPTILKKDDFYLAAVKENGHVLQYVPYEKKKKNFELCYEAVKEVIKKNPHKIDIIIRYVPTDFREDIKKLIAQNGQDEQDEKS